ncbi:oxidoreductase [Mycobacterium sp.]|uniref:oxidoreductase n=1 Tax=Mycobacterium sp. TaxID=1785 RepID=UPI00127FE340|nr:MAG: oxidoreductase [Mycobacterium sp.]
MGWIGTILPVGRVVERAGPAPQPVLNPPAGVRGSLQIRHADAGSCNGCEVEISAVFGPVYDAERFGARLVASPRRADGRLVTGVVIACGDCALNRGVFADAYGVVGASIPVEIRRICT